MERQTGQTPAALIGPPCPPALEGVWLDFLELGARRGGTGFGPAPLTFGDVEAWARLTGAAPVEPWRVAVLFRLDAVFLEQMAPKGSASGTRPAQRRH